MNILYLKLIIWHDICGYAELAVGVIALYWRLFVFYQQCNFIYKETERETGRRGHTVEDVFEMSEPDFAVIHAQVVQVDGVIFEFSSFAFAEEQRDA